MEGLDWIYMGANRYDKTLSPLWSPSLLLLSRRLSSLYPPERKSPGLQTVLPPKLPLSQTSKTFNRLLDHIISIGLNHFQVLENSRLLSNSERLYPCISAFFAPAPSSGGWWRRGGCFFPAAETERGRGGWGGGLAESQFGWGSFSKTLSSWDRFSITLLGWGRFHLGWVQFIRDDKFSFYQHQHPFHHPHQWLRAGGLGRRWSKRQPVHLPELRLQQQQEQVSPHFYPCHRHHHLRYAEICWFSIKMFLLDIFIPIYKALTLSSFTWKIQRLELLISSQNYFIFSSPHFHFSWNWLWVW